MAEELLVLRLVSLHNLQFMTDVTKMIRQAVQQGNFTEAKNQFLKDYFGNKT